ncbi:hypothetical protein QOT17_009292 [Balamuthia mandrillaris]
MDVEILQKLHGAAKVADKRATFFADCCAKTEFAALVALVGDAATATENVDEENRNPNVAPQQEKKVLLAVDILRLLATDEAHCKRLASETSLLPALKQLMFSSNPKIKKRAISVYKTLQCVPSASASTAFMHSEGKESSFADIEEKETATLASTRYFIRNCATGSAPSHLTERVLPLGKAAMFSTAPIAGLAAVASTSKEQGKSAAPTPNLGLASFLSERISTGMATASTFTLHIKGLNSETRKELLEKTLVQVQGVISFLIDVYSKRAIIRTMTSVEVILAAIRNTGMVPSLGEEEKEVSSPQYLRKEDVLNRRAHSKFGSIVQHGAHFGSDKAYQQEDSWFNRVSRAIWG